MHFAGSPSPLMDIRSSAILKLLSDPLQDRFWSVTRFSENGGLAIWTLAHICASPEGQGPHQGAEAQAMCLCYDRWNGPVSRGPTRAQRKRTPALPYPASRAPWSIDWTTGRHIGRDNQFQTEFSVTKTPIGSGSRLHCLPGEPSGSMARPATCAPWRRQTCRQGTSRRRGAALCRSESQSRLLP